MLAAIDIKLIKNILTLVVDGSRYPEAIRVFLFYSYETNVLL
jgi:hypothetical protein